MLNHQVNHTQRPTDLIDMTPEQSHHIVGFKPIGSLPSPNSFLKIFSSFFCTPLFWAFSINTRLGFLTMQLLTHFEYEHWAPYFIFEIYQKRWGCSVLLPWLSSMLGMLASFCVVYSMESFDFCFSDSSFWIVLIILEKIWGLSFDFCLSGSNF